MDLGRDHVILEKLDGSMITPISVDGDLRFATKMGINEISMQAEAFVAEHPAIYDFCVATMSRGWTPIFEWCSRKQKIVVDHPVDRLVLIAVRNTVTGEYLTHVQMMDATDGSFEVVRQYEGTVENMQHLVRHTRDVEGAEGFIVRFADGHMIKVKSDWYVTRHRAKDAIMHEKNVVSMLVNGEVDDVKAMLPDEDRARLVKFESEFWHGFESEVRRVQFLLDEHRKAVGGDRKVFAVERAPLIHPGRRAVIFACWDGAKEVRDCLLDVLRKSCGSQTNVDKARWVFGELTFWNYNGVSEDA
jgi:RNA ligase